MLEGSLVTASGEGKSLDEKYGKVKR